MTTHVMTKDPAELRVHPLKKQLPKSPEWQKGGASFNALCDDVADRGVDQPLIIDAQNFILDGELRWLAAKQAQLAEVPVVVREGNAAAVILTSITQRRHLTKGALAYGVFPVMAPAFDEAKQRHLAALKTGKNPSFSRSTLSVLRAATVEEMAERLGFSRVLFFQAQKLHDVFTKRPDLRSQFEPKIMSGEEALGACLAGIAGQDATKGKRKNESEQLELFSAGFNTLRTRFTYWQRFSSEAKEQARTVIEETVSSMPMDLREEFERALRKAKKGSTPELRAAA